MCLNIKNKNPKTYSRRRICYKVVSRGYSNEMRSSTPHGVYYAGHHYCYGKNISNRENTSLTDTEKLVRSIYRGFHLFYSLKDARHFTSNWSERFEIWKVEVERNKEVGAGTFYVDDLCYQMAVYTEFTWLETVAHVNC